MLKNSQLILRLPHSRIFHKRTKQTFASTDNRSLTNFFQAKTFLASLRSHVDHVLNFNSILGHIPGEVIVAAAYLSRNYINPDKLELN